MTWWNTVKRFSAKKLNTAYSNETYQRVRTVLIQIVPLVAMSILNCVVAVVLQRKNKAVFDLEQFIRKSKGNSERLRWPFVSWWPFASVLSHCFWHLSCWNTKLFLFRACFGSLLMQCITHPRLLTQSFVWHSFKATVVAWKVFSLGVGD